jgi:rubrerythrin
MNYSTVAVSTSTSFFIDKGKRIYSKGFKPETVAFDEVAGVMNTKAVAAVDFKSGKRNVSNIAEAYPVILEDFDQPGAYEYFEQCLINANIAYIRVPSRSYARYPYKFHYLIPTTAPLPMESKQAYELAKLSAYESIGIDIQRYKHDTDLKVAFDRARYLSPACENSDTMVKADSVSKTVHGKPLVVVKSEHSSDHEKPNTSVSKASGDHKSEQQNSLTCKTQWSVEAYRKSIIVYVADEVYYLNREAKIKTERGVIALGELDKLIPCDNTTTQIKSVCPICNSEHSDGIGEDYGWIQRSHTNNDIMLYCSGEHCNGKTFLIDNPDREVMEAKKLTITDIDVNRFAKETPSTLKLYLFYLSEAHYQSSNTILATIAYTKKKLSMGNDAHTKARRRLIEMGYIESIDKPYKGKVWNYTRLLYISGTGIRTEYCPECGSEIKHKPWQFCPECGVEHAS